jgi:UDP-N-acetylglucosamine 3-dehydrogenase
MSAKFTIGVIGAGMWGNQEIEKFSQATRSRVKWVCDPIQERLDKVTAKYPVEKTTPDYHDLLADPHLDAVVVVTPPYLHVPIALEALDAGKHVLIEKPMAINVSQIDQFTAAVKAHPNQVVLEGSCRHARLQPKFGFVKNFIESGALGDVYHMHFAGMGQGTFVEYNPQGTWGQTKRLAGGGAFLDWGVYDMSFHLGILGDKPQLTEMQAFTVNGLRDLSAYVETADVEQHGAALMKFDTGMTFYYERGSGVHNEVNFDTRIYGTRGGLRFQYPAWSGGAGGVGEIEYFCDEGGKPQQKKLSVDMSTHPPHDHIPVVEHFLDCLEGKAEPMMPADLAAKHLRILLQIIDSN